MICAAAPVGDADVGLRQEREARDELVKQWVQFPAADKAFCQGLHTISGEATHTELLTCLELRRDARMLREREKETTDGEDKSRRFDPSPIVDLHSFLFTQK